MPRTMLFNTASKWHTRTTQIIAHIAPIVVNFSTCREKQGPAIRRFVVLTLRRFAFRRLSSPRTRLKRCKRVGRSALKPVRAFMHRASLAVFGASKQAACQICDNSENREAMRGETRGFHWLAYGMHALLTSSAFAAR
jgi:hypothetical protein